MSSTGIKYPQTTKVTRAYSNSQIVESKWEDSTLKFLKASDGNFARTELLPKRSENTSKPGKLECTNFGFNIHENARIDGITVAVKDRIRDKDNKTKSLPGIPSLSVDLLGKNNLKAVAKTRNKSVGTTAQQRTFGSDTDSWIKISTGRYYPSLTPSQINDSEFGALLSWGRNTSTKNSGYLENDYVSMKIAYSLPKYSLKFSSKTQILKNGTVEVTITLANSVKGAYHGVAIPVQLNFNESNLYYRGTNSVNGSYNNLTKLWSAKLNSNNQAVLKLVFEGLNVGKHNISARVNISNVCDISNNTNINVSTSTIKATAKPSGAINLVQNNSMTYTIELLETTGLIGSANLLLPINNGIKVRSFKSNSTSATFNSKTGEWKAVFVNRKAVLTLYIVATSPGSYNQILTYNGNELLNNIFTITAEEFTKLSYIKATLPEEALQYLDDGVTYCLTCHSIIKDTYLTSVYNGRKNNKIAVKNGVEEQLGTRCSTLDSLEKIGVVFTYDSNNPIEVICFGQYLNMDLTNEVLFGAFELYEGDDLTAEYQNPILLFDNLQSLLENDDYTLTSLLPNTSTANYKFKGVNWGGFESDDSIIKRGFSVLVDYICDSPIVLEGRLRIGNDLISSINSIILSPEDTQAVIGSEVDKWGFNSNELDLENLSFELKWINKSLENVDLLIKNIMIVMFYDYDITGESKGFSLGGTHTREFNIVLNPKDLGYSEGAENEFETLSLKGGRGEAILSNKITASNFEFGFWIADCDITNTAKIVKEISRWFAKGRDKTVKPIKQDLILDWKPEDLYKVVLDGAISIEEIMGNNMRCKAKVIAHDGVAYSSNIIHTGEIGINEGQLPVEPVISFIAEGGYAKLYEKYTDTLMEFNREFEEGEEIIVDNENIKITNSLGEDISVDRTLRSSWFSLEDEYDFSSSENVIITDISYRTKG